MITKGNQLLLLLWYSGDLWHCCSAEMSWENWGQYCSVVFSQSLPLLALHLEPAVPCRPPRGTSLAVVRAITDTSRSGTFGVLTQGHCLLDTEGWNSLGVDCYLHRSSGTAVIS